MSIPAPQSVPLSPIARRQPSKTYHSHLLDSPPLDDALLLPSAVPITKNELSIPPSPLPAFVSSRIPAVYQDAINRNIGLLLVASAQLFFSLMNVSVKYFLSATHLSVLTLITVRMAMTSVFCTIALFLSRDPNPFLGPPEMRRLLCLRGFFGFIGLLSSYQSFRGLSISDSMTIQYLSPALTGVLGWLLLGEKMKGREVGVGVACLVGVVLVSRPPFIFGSTEVIIPGSERPGMGRMPVPGGYHPPEDDTSRMIAVAWSLLSVFAASAACQFNIVPYWSTTLKRLLDVTIRAIGDRAHALHSMVYFSNLSTICCGL
jgi:drug/metabolite transporter (DMT)-like permease